MEHGNLEQWLSRRASPPPASAGLAERIIHAAVMDIAQRQQGRNLWAEFTAMFALPHPAMIATVCVLFGLAAGLQAGDSLFALPQDWTAFLDVSEGEWL